MSDSGSPPGIVEEEVGDDPLEVVDESLEEQALGKESIIVENFENS